MPTFDFTSPDGKTYSVQGPDGATPEQAFEILQSQIGAPKQDAAPSSSVSGVGKSVATGLAEGVIGLAGLPGDLYHLGLRALGDNLTPESRFGSNALKKSVEGYTGEFYKPQGAIEETANKVGQFFPAVIGGPETLAAKFASRVAVPAVASQAAGMLAPESLKPYAEAAGALTGAAGASMLANRMGAAARNAAVPTVDELKNAARAGYRHQDVQDVRFTANAGNNLADTVSIDLRASGYRPNLDQNGKPVFGLVDELRQTSNVSDIDGIRRALGNVAKERDVSGLPTSNASAARRAIDHIDNFLPNLNQADLLVGDAGRANRILNEARQNWAAAKRAEQVQTLRANAELNAAAANSGQNIQNATRQAFKPLLRNNAAKAVGYNAEELQALNRVVRGDIVGGAARFAGNLLGGGGGLGMLAGAGAGYAAAGPEGAITAALAGRGLKAIGNRATFNAVQNLDRLLRSRSPAALQLAAQLPPAVVARLSPQARIMLATASLRPIVAPQLVPQGGQ